MNYFRRIGNWFGGRKNYRSQNNSQGDRPIIITTNDHDMSDIFGVSGSDNTLAMKVATVYRCVDILSSDVAMLSMRLMRRRTSTIDGERVSYFLPDEEMQLAKVLKRPNSRMSYYWTMKNAIQLMLLQGNAYLYKWYDAGELTKLVLINTAEGGGSVTYNNVADSYTIVDPINRIFKTVPSSAIIHLRNVSLDGGLTGVSTLENAANVLAIAVETDQQQKDTFKVGSTMRGFVTGDNGGVAGYGQTQDAQLESVTERINYGLLKNQRVNYIPGSMKFIPVSLSPADLQILDSKKWNCLEICRFFGVHPDKVFMQTSTNYKASANSQTTFMTDTLQPYLTMIAEEMNLKLIPDSMMFKLKIEFDLSNYYQTDLTAKGDYYKKMQEVGAMTPNEIRMKEGMAPVDGANKVLVSANLKTVEELNEDRTSTEEDKTEEQNSTGEGGKKTE